MPSMVSTTVEFLRLANIILEDQPHKYTALVNILTRGRSAVEVRTEVEEVLRDESLLIVAFNGLLPPALRIPSPDALPDFDQAYDFVSRVKERSRQQEGLLESFLHLMEMVLIGRKPHLEGTIEIIDLFRGHPDLLQDYLNFLPPDLQHLRSSL